MFVSSRTGMTARARYLSTQAKDDGLHYVHNAIGYNYRLPALAAALGLAQLEQLDDFVAAKKRRFAEYRHAIIDVPGLTLLDYPDYCDSNHWFFSLLIDPKRYGLDRDGLMAALTAAGIQSRPIWKLNHTQLPYCDCQTFRLEKTLFYFDHILNIPCSPGLTDAEMERVIRVLIRGGRLS